MVEIKEPWKSVRLCPGLQCRKYDAVNKTYRFRQYPHGMDYLGVQTEEAAISIVARLRENRKLDSGPQTWKDMLTEQAEASQSEKIQEERYRKELITQDFLEKNNTITKYYSETYWPERQKRKGSPNQNRTVDGHFRNWIKPIVGHIPFAELTYRDIDRIIQAVRDKGKTETTVKHIVDSLANIWNKAVADEIISKPFPRAKAESLHVDNEKTCFLTRDEADVLLETLKTWEPQTSLVKEKTLYGYCVLSLFSGLRCSEIQYLTWQNIASGKVTLTKNKKARTVHFDFPEIADMLEGRKDMFPNRKIHDYVFPEQCGNVAISKEFSRVVEQLGFNQVDHRLDNPREKINFHALRHTFASWLAMEGVPLFEIMVLLGHSSLRMVQRYASLSPAYTRSAVMKLSRMKDSDFLAQEDSRFQQRYEENAKIVQ